MNVLGYLRALIQETLARSMFLLGLISTSVTFLPSFGIQTPSPVALRWSGVVAMAVGFVLANYRVYTRQQVRIAALDAAVAAPAANPERDADELRAVLARLWGVYRNPIGRHVLAEIVNQDLGWDENRLNAAGFRAAGDFGHLRIGFDGRTFFLEQIPR